MTYLDGNFCDIFDITEYLFPWWTSSDIQTSGHITSSTIRAALVHYGDMLAVAPIDFGRTGEPNLSDQLHKPYYTWHSSVKDKLPNNCGRCRLYRSVALGVMDQVRDIVNMVHACQTANEAETTIAIRRASLFNELYEAALTKECKASKVKENEMETDSGAESVIEVESGSVIEISSGSECEELPTHSSDQRSKNSRRGCRTS